jgi:GntP family gluconate:H+ symporter
VWNNRPVTAAAVNSHSLFLLACVAGTVLTLLILIARLRLHPALALMIGALGLGLASGMPLAQVPVSFTTGVGNLMGHIAIILGLGAVLGRLLARSGAATSLGSFLVEVFGQGGVSWALLVLGIVVGMPVFFEVGLVLLMPIVIAAARQSGRPSILVGIPLLAGLSIMHGLVPPHPAAMLAAAQYHADMGRTIFWGLIVGVPAAAVAGPLLGWVLTRRWLKKNPQPVPPPGVPPETVTATAGTELSQPGLSPESLTSDSSQAAPTAERPLPASSEPLPAPAGPARAAFAILLPIALIFLGSWADALAAPGGVINRLLRFAGSPDIALLIAVLVGLVILGPRMQDGRHHGRELLRKLTTESFEPIANAMVILSAAGGLSGVLRESGAAQATVGLAMGAHMPPLVLAWLLAAVVRVSMGSATVAMAVSSGVLAPLVEHAGVRPELLVLATGSGSLMLSHVNDSGFWLVQSLFNLEMKQTLATWSVVETVLSVAGLAGTIVVSALLG